MKLGVVGLFTLPAAAVHAGANEVNLPPDMQTNRFSIWNQEYMFGDWGGARSRLVERGVTFDFINIGDFLADVSGSPADRGSYFGRLRASTDVDFNKLADFDGEFFFSGVWQYGQNFSRQYLRVNTQASSIAGAQTARIDQFWYQQGFFKDLFKLKVGQIAGVNEFGATDFFDILYNDELGYAPNALFSANQPFSPAGKPGVVAWGDLSVVTPGLYAKAGVFTAFDNPYHPDDSGVDYNDDFNHGWVASFEVGYQEQNTRYSGVYKLGINVNDQVEYLNPATGAEYTGNFTAYAIAEKTVYHPTDADQKLEMNKGLDLLLELVGAPDDRNALAYEVTLGGRYTGLIPGRDKDKLGFGYIYSQNGSTFSEAYEAANGHGLDGESTFELDYQFNPMSWFSFQIDGQYILDPGGNNERSGIMVLGLRTIFRF